MKKAFVFLAALACSSAALAEGDVFLSPGAEASLEWSGPDAVHVVGLREAPDTVCTVIQREKLSALFDCAGTLFPAWITSPKSIMFGTESFLLKESK